jgi:chemotaxis protein histidine kinase CheA
MYNESLLELYMLEATTLLDRLDGALARIRENGAFSRVEDADVKRIMATLKGSSDFMRFDVISDIASETERMLETISAISLGEADAQRLADLMSRVAAGIRGDIERRENGEPEAERPQELFDAIATFPGNPGNIDNVAKPVAPEPKAPVSPESPKMPAAQSASEVSRHILHLYFYEDSHMENVRAYLLTDRLSRCGNIVAAYPADIENDTEASEYIRENGYYIALDTTMLREQLEAMLKGRLSVESVSFTAAMPPEFDAEHPTEYVVSPAETIAARPVIAPVALDTPMTERETVTAVTEEIPPIAPAPAMTEREAVTAEFPSVPVAPGLAITEQKAVTTELPAAPIMPDPAITEQKPVTAHIPVARTSFDSAITEQKSVIWGLPAAPAGSDPAITELRAVPERYAEGTAMECIRISLSGELYSLPISCVRESFVAESEREMTVTHRGKEYPLIEIGTGLGVKNAVRAARDGVLLLVSVDEKKGCLLADSIIGTSPVTYAALPPFFNEYDPGARGVSGCAVSGEGDISLLLDPSTFLQEQKIL